MAPKVTTRRGRTKRSRRVVQSDMTAEQAIIAIRTSVRACARYLRRRGADVDAREAFRRDLREALEILDRPTAGLAERVIESTYPRGIVGKA
jgi:hypothetical protein